MSHSTDAWVLHRGEGPNAGRTELVREQFEFSDISNEECLVRPLYGCWEGNMSHALERKPVDIAAQRGEDRVVFGNAGVVEIIECGANVTTVKKGDIAILFCNGLWDQYGYPERIFAYDAPGTIGVCAKTTKMHQKQLIPVPKNTKYGLERWAAFSLRYPTAWSNWRLAIGTLRLQLNETELPTPTVWGWGGGVSLAELHLARLQGCNATQISSRDERLKVARDLGITAHDRTAIRALNYDEKRYRSDAEYKEKYLEAERTFLGWVNDETDGQGVNIFIDYIGTPVLRATLKALARQSVIATAGWKDGMYLKFLRALECINRHQHINTHYARYTEGVQAVAFAEANEWLPHADDYVYSFDEIPKCGHDYDANKFVFFPVFKVND